MPKVDLLDRLFQSPSEEAGLSIQATHDTAASLRRSMDAGEVSAVEAVERSLAQIELWNGRVNAVVAQRSQAALREAMQLDEIPLPERGPLHGVPMLIKDLNELREMPTTYGSRALADNIATFEALAVTRLRAAGAVVVGKSSTPEFGLRPTGDSALFGPTRNPFDLSRTSGGSSGGAAAALATGMVPVALGGDGGGSCRIPASCCGVVGMRPSRGRVPWAPIAYEYWGALATNGPMARTVKDAALLLDVIGGPVVGDPYGVATPSRTAADANRPLKIGVAIKPPHGHVDPEVISAVRDAQTVFRRLGHELVEFELDLTGLKEPWQVVVEASVAMTVEHTIGDKGLAKLEANTLALALRGRQASAADYAYAMHRMRSRCAEIMQSTEEFDVILTPTLTEPALAVETDLDTESHEERWDRYLDWLAFTYPTNCTGQPSISLPGGMSSSGLPIGIQLIGRLGDDDGLLSVAESFEGAQPWKHIYSLTGEPA
jgi:amidase/aspartyl-tRNA(Asn)/glutamyl-tRNA(Gln) amidotransferase subunit A